MSDTPTTSMAVVLGRMFWMAMGPILAAISLYYIGTAGTGWLTFADLLYFLIVGGMLLGRWVEFRGGNPQTSTGEPATPADLRRYVVTLTVLGPVLWVLANLIGNHLLAS
jgi:hypothetical protein